MAQRTAQQLDLPMSLSEGVRLSEQLTQVQISCAAWTEYAQELERTVNAAYRERDAARREVDSLRFQVRATQFLLKLQSDRVRATAAALPSWLNQELRRRLTMAHPDKWSRGQPATALAHAVAAAVNALRQRLGRVP